MYKKIISIHGVPRSGTSWLGQLFDSSPEVRYKFQPLFSNTFKNRIQVGSTEEDIINFFNDLYFTEDEFLDRVLQKEKGIHENFTLRNENPEFLVTKHVRYHYLIPNLLELDNIKIIAIIRNPCGVLNSWRKAPKEFREDVDGEFNNEWNYAIKRNGFKPEEFFGYNKWKEFTKYLIHFQKEFPSKVKVIKYEELVSNTQSITNELFDFVGLKNNEQTNNYINNSRTIHNKDIYSTFKADKNIFDWKTELDKSIIEFIYKDLANTELETFLD